MFEGLSTALAPWWQTVRPYRVWLLVALTVIFVLGVRWRLREMPLEREEGECAYAGQLMMHGVLPYQAADITQLPGACAAYAVIMAVFGQSPAGIHFGVALVNAASVVLMFLLGRKLLDDAAGLTAAAAFGLLSLSPAVLGLGGYATQFVVLAVLVSIWVLLRACEGTVPSPKSNAQSPEASVGSQAPASSAQTPPSGSMLSRYPLSTLISPHFLAGLLFGVALLMKQQGLCFGVFGALYLLQVRGGEWLAASEVRSQKPGIRSLREGTEYVFTSPASRAALARMLRALGSFTLGWLVPCAVACLVLWLGGALHQFVLGAISYVGQYGSFVRLVKRLGVFGTFLGAVMGSDLLLWILPWVGLVVMWWDERLGVRSPGAPSAPELPTSGIRHPRFFLTAWLLCSFAAVSLGLSFRAHYLILLLPAMALLTGVAVSRGLHLLRHDQTIELFLALPMVGLFVVAVGSALLGHGTVWFSLPPDQAMQSMFGTTLHAATARAANYIKSHTGPNARIAVLGSEPEIFFYSGRRSVSRHIYMYPLMAEDTHALQLQNQLIDDIERAQPEYVLVIDQPSSWLSPSQTSQMIFGWWVAYWARCMDLETTMGIDDGQERTTEAYKPAKLEPPRCHILIFKRRQ